MRTIYKGDDCMFLINLIPFVFILIGVLNILFPRMSWYMRAGWQFKNAEPSAAALVSARVSGVIAIILGLFLLTSGILPG